ncbi:unnamed protein product [Pleuronectes platessa]|uniref:Uncharacterized protein n=1 Tax=Pleuronectes platessa TaxID=8262 RepID=A0A9N7YUD1_PLEPL|nr:unnamed protein product [Pleuronectes platessa]
MSLSHSLVILQVRRILVPDLITAARSGEEEAERRRLIKRLFSRRQRAARQQMKLKQSRADRSTIRTRRDQSSGQIRGPRRVVGSQDPTRWEDEAAPPPPPGGAPTHHVTGALVLPLHVSSPPRSRMAGKLNPDLLLPRQRSGRRRVAGRWNNTLESQSCSSRMKYTPGCNQSALFTGAVVLMRSPAAPPPTLDAVPPA